MSTFEDFPERLLLHGAEIDTKGVVLDSCYNYGIE